MHKLFLLDLAQQVQKLLRPAHGEGRDNDAAAAVERPLQNLCQLRAHVLGLVVQAVAVGRLDNEIVRLGDGQGIVQDRLVNVADVAGEHNFFLGAVLPQPELNAGRAQQMADIGKAHAQAVGNRHAFAIPAGTEARRRALRIVNGVQRFDRRLARTLSLARFPRGLGFLNVRRVAQHNVGQTARGRCSVDFSPEAVLIELRQKPRVVDMRMGQKDGADVLRRDGQRDILVNVHALLHAPVDQVVLSCQLQQRTAPRDLMGRADECDLHRQIPPFYIQYSINHRFCNRPPARENNFCLSEKSS